MEHIEIFFMLLFAAVLLIGLAQRIYIPYPITLVIGGTIIGFIPGLHAITFDPNLILIIVLPPVLYYAALGIAFQEFRKNWKEIFFFGSWTCCFHNDCHRSHFQVDVSTIFVGAGFCFWGDCFAT